MGAADGDPLYATRNSDGLSLKILLQKNFLARCVKADSVTSRFASATYSQPSRKSLNEEIAISAKKL